MSDEQQSDLRPVAPPTASMPTLSVSKPDKIGHDLRGWVKEILIVVIGVVLALGAGQIANSVHWQQQVAASQDTLRDNLRVLIASAAQREAQSPCQGRRLAALAELIDQASASGRLPAIGQLGSPGRNTFNFDSWDTLVAAQVTPHLTRDQMGNYASINSAVGLLRTTSAEEVAEWATLYSVVGPGRRFGDAEQATTRAALSRAVLAAKSLRATAASLARAVADSGLLTSAEITAIRKKAGEDYASYSRDGIMCKPLRDAPRADHYGQAPSPIDLLEPFRP